MDEFQWHRDDQPPHGDLLEVEPARSNPILLDVPAGAPATPPERRAGGRLATVAAIAALIGSMVGTGATLAFTSRGGTTIERVAAATTGSGALPAGGAASVAKAVIPSIVRIDVTEQQNAFGQTGSGTGSGVIISSNGYIVTNNHVTSGATSIQVTLSTGEKLTGTLVGTAAPVDDIAVVKVNKTGLPAATLGSTSSLAVGDLAVAIGSPFGLQGSVTAGVISALHRNIDLGQNETLTDAIQTDAPINPGNSGGALANSVGAVVGINTAILGSTGGNVGVGFAIPMDIARRDAEQIMNTGKVSRAYMGVSGSSIPNGGGALLQSVVSGGPAQKAGLAAGDIVTSVGATKITSMEDLIAALNTHKAGDVVTVGYERSGAHHTTKLTLTVRST